MLPWHLRRGLSTSKNLSPSEGSGKRSSAGKAVWLRGLAKTAGKPSIPRARVYPGRKTLKAGGGTSSGRHLFLAYRAVGGWTCLAYFGHILFLGGCGEPSRGRRISGDLEGFWCAMGCDGMFALNVPLLREPPPAALGNLEKPSNFHNWRPLSLYLHKGWQIAGRCYVHSKWMKTPTDFNIF